MDAVSILMQLSGRGRRSLPGGRTVRRTDGSTLRIFPCRKFSSLWLTYVSWICPWINLYRACVLFRRSDIWWLSLSRNLWMYCKSSGGVSILICSSQYAADLSRFCGSVVGGDTGLISSRISSTGYVFILSSDRFQILINTAVYALSLVPSRYFWRDLACMGGVAGLAFRSWPYMRLSFFRNL